MDLDTLADAAHTAACAGGQIVATSFGAARDVQEKAPGDWVSEADLTSERAIRDVLQAMAPDIPVFGEEGDGAEGWANARRAGAASSDERGDGRSAELGWLVDPLDGTSNFLHRFPVVGVSIALVDAGRPVVGVVHAPLLGDTYVAVRDRGAFRGQERLQVSGRDPTQAICATGFPFRHKEWLPTYLRAFEDAIARFEDLRRAGAASLDLAWTATGTFDGFFELALGPWDVAAGALLVLEAGGIVTDWSGDGGRWLDTGDILAASPAVHEQLLDLARASGR
jgi:myo-inositol-1(or 4)-monophosphatase